MPWTNSLVASYSGDSKYLAGATQPMVETFLSQFTPTATILNASLDPSAVGQSVTLTAQLKYSLPGNISTSVVTFIDTNTCNVLGAADLQTSGAAHELVTLASLTRSSLGAGTYAVQAVCSGSNIYAPSTSPVLNQISRKITPTIASILTTKGERASENSIIAQNAWVEIHGANQRPRLEQAGFFTGLPIALGGVSATVNNKPAAILYVSPAQVNILVPLDDSTGPAAVQLVTPYGNTAIASPTMLPVSPSSLVIDSAGHVAARHADFSPAGSGALSSPAITVTPVKPSETVLLYAVGVGQTSPPMADQFLGLGSLPALPVVTIGGIPSTVEAAGICSPGLHQLNVIVPPSAQHSDLTVSATYEGVATQLGVSSPCSSDTEIICGKEIA